MAQKTIRNKKHLLDIYEAIVWSLSAYGLNDSDVGLVLNRHRSVIKRVSDRKPKGFEPKWVKVS